MTVFWTVTHARLFAGHELARSHGNYRIVEITFKITHNAAIKAFFKKLNLFCSYYKNQSINSDRLFIIKMVNEMIKVSYIFVKYNAYLVYSCSVQYAQTKRVRKLSMLLCNI